MNLSRPLLVALFAALSPGAPAMETLPVARDDSVLGEFQTYCLRQSPDYDRLEGQAKADNMTDLGSHTGPGPGGSTIQSHRWGGKLPDGPFALYLSKVAAQGEVETSCGISGMVPDAEHFRDGMVRTMALPPLESHALDRDGSTLYVWKDFPLRDHRLILQTKRAKDGQGFVLVTLAVKRPS